MEKKYLRNLFLFEIFVVVAVPFIFKYIEPKKVAALYAGSLFIVLGISVLFGCLRYELLRRTFLTVIACVHLFLVSIPMMAMRVYFFDRDFDQIQIMGMSGPIFHKYSEWIYILLLGATIYQWVRVGRSERNKPIG